MTHSSLFLQQAAEVFTSWSQGFRKSTIMMFLFLVYLASGSMVSSEHTDPTYLTADVAIVGAGYAGLTAAKWLREKHNLTVHVLEASNTSGGRTKNWDLESQGPDRESSLAVELGGQWIGNASVQQHSWNLIVEELGFDVFDASYTHGSGQSILVASDGRHNFTSMVDMLHQFPTPVKNELTEALDILEEYSSTLNLSSPWDSPRAREWDSMTFTSWINGTVTLQESRTMLQVLCTTMIAQSADVVSFLHILFYIRAANGLRNLVVNEQQYRVKGGTQAPALHMAKVLNNEGRIHYLSPVTLIQQNDESVTLTVTKQGQLDADLVVTASHAIVTGAPPTVNRFIEFDPPLPYSKRQLFERLPLGNSVKAQLVYEEGPFWRDAGWSGTIMASTPSFQVGGGQPLLSNCMDNTPEAGKPGVMLCFLEGDTSVEMMERFSHEDRKSYIADWVARSFGPQAHDPDILLDFNWAAQPFIGGAYSSYFPTGVWTQMGSALREPYGRIFWAGADYAEEGFGYINGAIESAGRAVDEIMSRHAAEA